MTTRWWPPIGLGAMVLLGWLVADGSTSLDDWFHHLGDRMGRWSYAFLVFTYPPLVAAVLAVVIAVVLRRRQWWLAAAMVVSPPLAVVIAQICKRLFGREKQAALAYPSGHTTFLVVVMGLLVVAAGAAVWSVIVAVTLSVLGIFGQGITHHYFTDTIGAALLATSVVCIVASLARRPLDTCQPRGDLRHNRSLAWPHDRDARK